MAQLQQDKFMIGAPQPHQDAVERSALLNRMFDCKARVVVFQGPAGHGKTSLMLQADKVCRTRNMLTGWISLQKSDNDLRRFLQRIEDILEFMGSQPESKLLDGDEVDESTITSSTDWILNRFLGLGSEVAVFLDDLHVVSERPTLNFLRELLARSPSRIRWFLASRVVPELGLPRLVVGDQALIIQPMELRFTRDEMQRFFCQSSTLNLRDDELDTIYAATEGWPAATQLYRLALASPVVRRSLTSGRHHHLTEMSGYLADNVFAQQTPEIQEFLLMTSVLERMSPEQCNTLLERTDSFQILEELEHRGLFVRRLELDGDWFNYHALFSKFLHDHLQKTRSDSIAMLHRRAADWYWTHNYLEDALHHSLCAHDYTTACKVFDQWADILIPDGYFATVIHWSGEMPTHELVKQEGLIAKIVWAFTFLSRHSNVETLVTILNSRIDDPDPSVDSAIALSMVSILKDDLKGCLEHISWIDTHIHSSQRFRTFGLSAVSNARGYVAMGHGNLDAALECLSYGRELSERANATFTMAYSMAISGIAMFAQGRLQEALIRFRAAMNDSRMYLNQSVSMASLVSSFIMALYEVNEVDTALEQFNLNRDMIADGAIHDFLVICYRAIARIHDLRGSPEAALSSLEEAERYAYACHWPRAVELINWERIRRELLSGHIGRAELIASRIEESEHHRDDEWIRFSEEGDDHCLGRIRLSIHAGRYAQAIEAIQQPLRVAIKQNRIYRQIKLHHFAAMAYQGKNDNKQAHRNLHLALGLASPGNYLRSFLDEGENLTQMFQPHLFLQTAAPPSVENDKLTEFLRKLIGLAEVKTSAVSYLVKGENSTHDRAVSLHQPLTKQEKKILNMLLKYMTNDQIANSLFVSRETVKYHLKNIYGKLGVRSRLEAIRATVTLELGN